MLYFPFLPFGPHFRGDFLRSVSLMMEITLLINILVGFSEKLFGKIVGKHVVRSVVGWGMERRKNKSALSELGN